MNAKELRVKSLTELKLVEADLLQESFNLQMQKVTGQLNKSHQIKNVKKDIARVYTIITEKGSQA
jgi:large subunit ribosomal protein L29